MANDAQTELRLARLENDSNALYDLIAGVVSTQQDHSLRFDAMDARFDAMDGRLDAMDGRLDAMDGRLDAMDGRLDAMDGRFDAVDARFDSVEVTLAEIVRRLPEPT